MFIPFNTDAPIYHLPTATVGLIVVNCAFSFLMWSLPLSVAEEWILVYGQGLHPLQWFSSIFMHGDIMHLVGNMIFLWVFGLLVEGKLGWWKFLLVYLGIGVGQSALEQVMMLGYEGSPGSLGASAAIFGLVAIALIWAPKNEINCMYFIWFFPRFVELPLTGFAAFYFGLQVFLWMLSSFQAGSELLHLMGVAMGLVVGVVMVKKNLVDCEGWDLFSVLKGTEGTIGRKMKEEDLQRKVEKHQTKQQQQQDQLLRRAEQQIAKFASEGNVVAALALMRKMSELGEVHLDRPVLRKIVSELLKQKRWSEALSPMKMLIDQDPDKAGQVRLKLAQILLLHERRPGQALSVLEKITPGDLAARENVLREQLIRKAREMQDDADLELDTDDE